MSIVGFWLAIWMVVSVAMVGVNRWLGRKAQAAHPVPYPPAPEMPARYRRRKILWVDGQPTMSYSIVRLPKHWAN